MSIAVYELVDACGPGYGEVMARARPAECVALEHGDASGAQLLWAVVSATGCARGSGGGGRQRLLSRWLV